MSRVLAYLGLRRPYRFERAVPVVLALALAAMIAGTAAGLVVAGASLPGYRAFPGLPVLAGALQVASARIDLPLAVE